MSKKRPTEASWESDEDLLGDTSSVSAFSSKMQGDLLLDDQIDEDALLELDAEDTTQNYSFDTQNDIVERIDLGISSDNCGFDDTANSQELDYEDVLEEVQPEENFEITDETEDPLLVEEQPNDTVCTAQPTKPIPITFAQEDEDSDEENEKKGRGRFQTERNTVSLSSAHTKPTDIPDSLEITKEMQEEIDSFEKQKGRKKFDRQRLGQRNRGQQQQFRPPMPRGSPRQRGPNMGQRSLMSQGRFPGPRNNSPMRGRGSQNMGGQRGRSQGQFQRGFNPRPGLNNGRPRFPHEIQQQGHQPGFTGSAPQMPQPLLSSQPQTQPMYQEQHQFIQPQPDQPHFMQPQHEPQFQQPQHSQPQPLIPMSQSAGSTIHVNPNFQGHLPPDIRPQQHVAPHSVPQPMFSQPQPVQTFQQTSPGWSQQSSHPAPVHVSYAPSPQHHQPVQTHAQQPNITPPPSQRPGLLASPQHGVIQNRPPHQGAPHLQPPQLMSQGQPRQPFQQFQPRPQQASVRPISQRIGQRPNAQQRPHSAPQQVRQQRPMANQNMRGPRPVNQVRGNLTQMRPRGTTPANLRPRTAQMGQPCFQTPQVSAPSQQGWNPKPAQLVAPMKQVEQVDPDKQRKVHELEMQKRKRAERFKNNIPVKINEGSPSNTKIIIHKAEKRPSGDANREPDDISPIKTIKIEKGSEITVIGAASSSGDAPEEMDHDEALRRALQEQKRHRDLVKKAKEAKRQASANIRRRTLALKLAKEGKTLADVVSPAEENEGTDVKQNVTSQYQGQEQHGQGQQQFQSQQQFQGQQQQFQRQQQQFQGQQQQFQGQRQQFQGQQQQFQGQQQNRGQQQYQGQQQFQGQQQYQGQQQFQGQQQQFRGQGQQQQIPVQQQNVHQKQFNKNVAVRDVNRGQMSNRGQSMNRGQGIRSQGQPISVLGQSPPAATSSQVGRGYGNVRGHGQARGRGRGIQKQTSFSQLQQVQIQENIDYESYDNQFSSEGPVNRTVLPASTRSRQIVGMNSMGAASQVVPERKVLERKGAALPQRRIVVDSKQSSSVLIKDLPLRVDLGQISKRCSEYGKTKVFNYKAEEKTIVVQFSSPAEAAAFLKKNSRFMLDMNYYTAVTIPDYSV